VEWQEKKLVGTQPLTPIQTHHVTYNRTKNISKQKTNIRSSLHCVVLHTLQQKNSLIACEKNALSTQ
jgi:hypothetical protein